MLGVAALLASSSMAAIELITLYARLDNAVHKMPPPLPPAPLHLPVSRCVCSALAAEKGSSVAVEELESALSSFISR